MMNARKFVWPAVITAVFLGAGFGRTAETPPEPSSSSVVTVKIHTDASQRCDKAYDPSVVTIKAGTTVEWINLDYETHTLVSSEGGDPCRQKELSPEARVIDVGQFLRQATYRKTFTKPGEYPYACHLPFHRMSGKIIVVP